MTFKIGGKVICIKTPMESWINSSVKKPEVTKIYTISDIGDTCRCGLRILLEECGPSNNSMPWSCFCSPLNIFHAGAISGWGKVCFNTFLPPESFLTKEDIDVIGRDVVKEQIGQVAKRQKILAPRIEKIDEWWKERFDGIG